MWEREAAFIELLGSVQQRASRASIDALAQMAVEDHKHVSDILMQDFLRPWHAVQR